MVSMIKQEDWLPDLRDICVTEQEDLCSFGGDGEKFLLK